MSQTVGDFIVQRLHALGVRKIFSYPGDGINGVIEWINGADGKIEFHLRRVIRADSYHPVSISYPQALK